MLEQELGIRAWVCNAVHIIVSAAVSSGSKGKAISSASNFGVTYGTAPGSQIALTLADVALGLAGVAKVRGLCSKA